LLRAKGLHLHHHDISIENGAALGRPRGERSELVLEGRLEAARLLRQGNVGPEQILTTGPEIARIIEVLDRSIQRPVVNAPALSSQ
jgi:hypothetical protein